MNYREIFEEASLEAQSETFEVEGRDIMIYPCGFAWISFAGGKKDPIGKEFQKLDLAYYDDYRKRYIIQIYEYNQSMNHKETHARLLAKILSEKLNVEIGYGSRID